MKAALSMVRALRGLLAHDNIADYWSVVTEMPRRDDLLRSFTVPVLYQTCFPC